MTKNWEKKIFDQKISIYLSLGFHEGRQSYIRSLQPSKRISSTYKHKFLKNVLFLWVIFALLDPDPDTDPLTWLNPDPIQLWIRVRKLLITIQVYTIVPFMQDFWIRMDQHWFCHFGRLDPDPEGQKRPRKIDKLKKFHVLKCWMFSVEGWRLLM